VVLLKERLRGILDRQSEEAECIQGKKEDTWDITRGNFQVRRGSAQIWFTHVLSNKALRLCCRNNQRGLN